MKLADIMIHNPKTVRPTDSLALARSIMVWGDCRSLPVVAEDELVGLLTEFDIARHQARNTGVTSTSQVMAAMNPEPQTAHADDSVTEAMARMAEYKLMCLPIVERKKLLGVVTTTDLLRSQVQKAMKGSEDEGPRVSDVMTPDPVSAHPDDPLVDAAAKMSTLRVRHLPVVDGEQKVIGMLSDRDVRGAIGDPAGETSSLTDYLRVSHAMSRPVVTAWPEQSCAEAARAFVTMYASAVPVVTRDKGTLVGILSYVDLLRGTPR